MIPKSNERDKCYESDSCWGVFSSARLWFYSVISLLYVDHMPPATNQIFIQAHSVGNSGRLLFSHLYYCNFCLTFLYFFLRPSYLNKFHSDRGSIASRWAWLRSQVVDVERRIRRCEETYKSIRLRKGSIQLGKQKVVVERRTVVSVANKSAEDLLVDTVNILNSLKEPHNLNNSIRTGSQRPEVSISRNSNSMLTEEHKEKTNSIMNNGKSNMHLTDHIYSCTAARTRSVQYWQKRKLFSLLQLQKPNQNVLCACSSPLTPCVLCQRNSKNLSVLKPKQSIKERVSLLDSSFHPVLSFDTGKRYQLLLSFKLYNTVCGYFVLNDYFSVFNWTPNNLPYSTNIINYVAGSRTEGWSR